MSNIVQRILSAMVLLPATLWLLWKGGYWLDGLLTTMAILMAYEWRMITSREPVAQSLQARHALHLSSLEQMRTTLEGGRFFPWQAAGLVYIGLPLLSLLALYEEYGVWMVLWMLSLVWTTDIMAYITGRIVGGIKLAPRITPNKTWSGAFGGLLATMWLGPCLWKYLELEGLPEEWIYPVSGLLSCISQMGDLFESWLKRHFGVKDSGSLIPGHGGVLDRVDGVVAVAPCCWGMMQLASSIGL